MCASREYVVLGLVTGTDITCEIVLGGIWPRVSVPDVSSSYATSPAFSIETSTSLFSCSCMRPISEAATTVGSIGYG